MDWATRMTIVKGTARGLAYLHEWMSIIHGNLTASNVLLDEQNNPKIAHFGLFRLMTVSNDLLDEQGNPKIVHSGLSRLMTAARALWHGAPKLSKLKKANNKTDMYCLGVIILELLTGKCATDSTNGMDLLQWVTSMVKEEWASEVFDLELKWEAAEGNVSNELTHTLNLALQCVDPSPSVRPEAREVLLQLEQIRPEVGWWRQTEGEQAHVPVPAGGDEE